MTNEDVLKKIREAKASGVTELDLSHKGLTTLPSEIGQLDNLTHLNLSDNQLTDLPPTICKLTNLRYFDLWNNQLTDLPSVICHLKELTALNFSGNRLTPLMPEISQLKNLTYLNLSWNQLTDLPPAICKLTNLRDFDLWGNQLAKLPQDIGQLTTLRKLNLGHNQLSILPPELFQLTGLTELNLSRNKLNTLPPEFFQMTELIRLDLNDNKLTALPPEISQLIYLEKLHLWDNQLSFLPSEIGHLKSLAALHLYNNRLTSLPPEIGQLTKLENFYSWNNLLSSLPPEICQLARLKTLKLDDNPLTSPPLEIASRGIGAIRRYFIEIDTVSQPLNEVKIILVGEGAAGKTSLTKQLLNEPFDPEEDATHGIRISRWQSDSGSKQIRVNLWDFGGQEIMHATHQFFLSKRSLYVLVLDGRKDERPEYWLRHIETFGGNSPVLIVLNKLDANPGFDLDRKALRRKYPGIKDFFRTSCITKEGIDTFRAALISQLEQVGMIGIRLPKSWFRVKEQLENEQDPFISLELYETICARAGITEKISQETLVDFLHDLGVAVHFKETELKDVHVLNPLWVTEGVYKIVTAKQVADDGGILHVDSLEEILKQKKDGDHFYHKNRHRYLLDLMKQFELCYSLDRERVLIPQLLPMVEPEFPFDNAYSLQFELFYDDFLPLSVIPRFMVRSYLDIKDDLRWRTGVVLENKESQSRAVVIADNETRRISISVSGAQRHVYFAVILLFFREINLGFNKLKVSELLLVQDDPKRAADYQTLLEYADHNIDTYIPPGSKKLCSVRELLRPLRLDDGQDDWQKVLNILLKSSAVSVNDEQSWVERLNKIIDLKPNLNGIGVDINKLIEELVIAYKKWRTKQSKKGKDHQ